MKILAIDTSASPVSAAITDDGFLLGEFYLNTRTTHSQTLMPIIEALLKTVCLKPADIDYFAVNAGPGSFTGVRIGTASVKGMAMPIDKPCVSVSTLEAMAYGSPFENAVVCAVMDARCSQVYNALFRLEKGKVTRLCEDRALSLDELKTELHGFINDTVYLVGDGAQLCFNAIISELPEIRLAPANVLFQHAYGTAAAATVHIENGDITDADKLMPIYLRLPQAERELKARQAASKDNT